MGRPRKTEAQRRAEKFKEIYCAGKGRMGLTDVQIGQMAGLSPTTLREYRQNPEKFIGKFVRLGKVLGWSDEEYLTLIHPEGVKF